MKSLFLTLVLVVLATAASAEETTKLSAIEQFEEQKAIILKDIKDDTVYREISYSDANVVRDALNRISASLEGIVDIAEMTEEERGALFNDQELVNTVLTMAENDSRMVCRRRGRLGTNFKTTTCESVKDRRERQEADRLAIDQLMRGTPITSN